MAYDNPTRQERILYCRTVWRSLWIFSLWLWETTEDIETGNKTWADRYSHLQLDEMWLIWFLCWRSMMHKQKTVKTRSFIIYNICPLNMHLNTQGFKETSGTMSFLVLLLEITLGRDTFRKTVEECTKESMNFVFSSQWESIREYVRWGESNVEFWLRLRMWRKGGHKRKRLN